MIDPINITNYNLTDSQLEEHLLFWIAVAGKTATTTAKLLDRLLQEIKGMGGQGSPFNLIKTVNDNSCDNDWLSKLMRQVGFGCYKHKSKGILQAAYSNLNLRTCGVDDLEKIHFVGMKTSRCFLIHSRQGVEHAGLDTHILRYLADQGYDVPKSTPASKKRYIEIENLFISLAKKSSMALAEFDLKIWREYSKN